eukprot:1883626-Rhodomonas_salina.2
MAQQWASDLLEGVKFMHSKKVALANHHCHDAKHDEDEDDDDADRHRIVMVMMRIDYFVRRMAWVLQQSNWNIRWRAALSDTTSASTSKMSRLIDSDSGGRCAGVIAAAAAADHDESSTS